ncbi:hypothetical protein AVEN_188675-1 [Araneus ventricosus]|uniref:Uncharacterized protein n=1 Tax=Araneus ventricosus TaxID=182803 RepID=A0A4Y2D6T8_ARAVE|nr:hypothetical protein AVEN_188675-1 [Araneus ventricosus]
MQFLPSPRGVPKPTKNLNEYCGSTLHRRDRYPVCGMAATFPWRNICKRSEVKRKWIETSVQFLRAVVDCVCNLESIFDHPLFGCSNYDGSNAATSTLGTGLFYLCALEKLTKERVLFICPTLPGGANCLLFKGTLSPSGRLATSPVRH